MIVTPTLLEQDTKKQKEELLTLSRFFSRFQIDIADNTFVPNTTAQIDELAESSFFNLISEISFDFHLMVDDPKKHIALINCLPKKRVGVILIHRFVFPDYKELKTAYPELRFGLVLNPEDKVNNIKEELLEQIAAVQIMTVTPGFQGSAFIKEEIIKIEQLRKRGFKKEIVIDGAVNAATIPLILSLEYKPDVLGVGSFLTKSPPHELKRRIAFLNSRFPSKE